MTLPIGLLVPNYGPSVIGAEGPVLIPINSTIYCILYIILYIILPSIY